MATTFSESVIEKGTLSRKDAWRLVRQHGAMVEDFVADFGDCDTYDAVELMGWLGY